MSTKVPDPGDVGRNVIGAMVSGDPPDGLGWATAKKPDGTPIYLVAVVLGSENCQNMDKALAKLAPKMHPVDTFSDLPEPA